MAITAVVFTILGVYGLGYLFLFCYGLFFHFCGRPALSGFNFVTPFDGFQCFKDGLSDASFGILFCQAKDTSIVWGAEYPNAHFSVDIDMFQNFSSPGYRAGNLHKHACMLSCDRTCHRLTGPSLFVLPSHFVSADLPRAAFF
jgi:hypothetical protein